MADIATKPQAKNTKKGQSEVMVLELIDKRQSSWILEGSAEQGLAQWLDSPVERRILNQGYELDTRADAAPGSYRRIRYVAGCDSIYPEEQEQKGYRTDEMGRIINRTPGIDDIWLKNGFLTVVDEGVSKPLFTYLRHCDMNKDAVNLPPNANPIFQELKQSKKAEDALMLIDARHEATQVVRSLYEKTAKGYTYDETKIDFLCSLFNISALGSYPEKVQVLSTWAETYPDRFMNSVADANKEMRVDITQALHYGVINPQGEYASFVASKRTFLKFRAAEKNREDRINEIIEYFMSVNGATDYKECKIELDAAKRRQVELKN